MEDKRRDRFKFTRTKTESLVFTGFIKSTDHRPTDQPTTDHLLTNPPNNRPQTHRPTNPIITDPFDKILFQSLDQ